MKERTVRAVYEPCRSTKFRGGVPYATVWQVKVVYDDGGEEVVECPTLEEARVLQAEPKQSLLRELDAIDEASKKLNAARSAKTLKMAKRSILPSCKLDDYLLEKKRKREKEMYAMKKERQPAKVDGRLSRIKPFEEMTKYSLNTIIWRLQKKIKDGFGDDISRARLAAAEAYRAKSKGGTTEMPNSGHRDDAADASPRANGPSSSPEAPMGALSPRGGVPGREPKIAPVMRRYYSDGAPSAPDPFVLMDKINEIIDWINAR
jgi:hypothetical protein